MPDKTLRLTNTHHNQRYHEMSHGEEDLSDFCHILASISHKAKRLSSNTSAGETLAAVLGKEICQLVALRLTEVLSCGIQLPLKTAATLPQLIELQESAGWCIPIDHYTDCRDLFQLMVGEKGVPQDRYQRLYILSLREDRLKGAIRRVLWIPTGGMLADPLTKSMLSPILYDLLTHGYWRCKCTQLQPLVAPPLRVSSFTEETIMDMSPTTLAALD